MSDARRRNHRIHRLKTWPSEFNAMVAGDKTFEYRRNDRDFAVGDEVSLEEWDPAGTTPFRGPGGGTIKGAWSGRKLKARISYKLEGTFGVPPGYAVLSLRDVVVIEP